MHYDPKEISRFPTAPGVYLMKNQRGTILYIGKAKNLRQRVKQYFVPGRDEREMIPFLIARVYDIETIVVASEKEALLLENTLIKEHQPRYNALLKDDKSYVSLKVNSKHKWPMVRLVRYKGKPKTDGTYFGPYTSAYAARQTLDLLKRIFPLRQCSDQELVRRSRPCLLYDMKRCIAPCVDRCTKDEYDRYVRKTLKFLKGQDQEVLKELHDEMQAASDALEFEQAAAILRKIRAIERTVEGQSVVKVQGKDADVYGIFREGEEVMLCQMLFRSGKLLGTQSHSFSSIAQDDPELLASFLLQQYRAVDAVPDEILLPVRIEGQSVVEEILAGLRGKKVAVITPQKGEKRRLIEMAYSNAKVGYTREKDAAAVREKMLIELQERLRLRSYPRRIECFDNAHMQGAEAVAAMVAFTDGEKDKKRYRLYKLKATDPGDDYGAMREVLGRRYRKAQEEGSLPDLIVVDGGKGQLNAAVRVLQELGIVTIDIISLAKEEGRHDKGITAERIFVREAKDPVVLKKTSPALFLLQKIRDEAHRSAITFHRKQRSKRTVKSALDQVPGIGPKKRQRLLKHFGSLKRILAANNEELMDVESIGPRDVAALRAAFPQE